MRRFDSQSPDFETAFAAFVSEPRGSPADVDVAVAEILERVRREGLPAVLDYARRFDRAELTEATIRVTADEIAVGAAACEPRVR
jgi:histidinol dehydrogenase